jgi:alpha-L-fucosidase
MPTRPKPLDLISGSSISVDRNAGWNDAPPLAAPRIAGKISFAWTIVVSLGLAGPVPAVIAPPAATPSGPHRIAAGLFQPTWESLAAGYRAPAWFRDAKFGIWAHWSAQCVPEHVVSKNGNLLLSIPMRGDGTIDEDEVAFLEGMAKWMNINGEAIFATRPWGVYGDGPSTVEVPEPGHNGGARDVRSKPYTAEDIRFTRKGDSLYAILLDWPATRSVVIRSLRADTSGTAGKVSGVKLLGSDGPVAWSQDGTGLHVRLPATAPSEYAVALKISGAIAPASAAPSRS